MRDVAATVVGLVAAAVIFLGAPPASAQTPPSNGVIHACVQQGSLQVRIVSATEPCRGTESPVVWNIQGPKGDKGETGLTGPPGPSGGSFTSGLVAWTKEISSCGAGELEGCDTKSVLNVGVADGQPVDLSLRYDVVGGTEVYGIRVSKELGPTGTEFDYRVSLTFTKNNGAIPGGVSVSPSVPLYNTAADMHCTLLPGDCPFAFAARLISDSMITLVVNRPDVVSQITTESSGVIDDVKAAPSDDGITVRIWNTGNFRASYIVTVDNCSDPFAPMVSQARTLQVAEIASLKFPFKTTRPASTGSYMCNVALFSAAGRVLDWVPVVFNRVAPQTAAVR